MQKVKAKTGVMCVIGKSRGDQTKQKDNIFTKSILKSMTIKKL